MLVGVCDIWGREGVSDREIGGVSERAMGDVSERVGVWLSPMSSAILCSEHEMVVRSLLFMQHPCFYSYF